MSQPRVPTLWQAAVEMEQALMRALRGPKFSDRVRLESRFSSLGARFLADSEPYLRLSFGTFCARYQWYVHNQPDKFEPRGEERLQHLMGDLFERVALGLLEEELREDPYWSLDPLWDQREIQLSGISGHTDAGLYWCGQPFALLDTKFTKSFLYRHWEPKGQKPRIPPLKWGYRHQAGNYLGAARSIGAAFRGFIWVLGFMDAPKRVGSGWMSREELMPYENQALQMYDTARTRTTPPPPCHPGKDKSPCMRWLNRSEGTREIYCKAFEHCTNDTR